MTGRPAECGVEERPHPSVVAPDLRATPRRPDARRLYAPVLFIPFFYILVRYLPPVALFGLVLVITLLALTEFYRLSFRTSPDAAGATVGLALSGLLLVSLQWPHIISERTVWILTIAAVLISRLCSTQELGRRLIDAAVLVFGIGYVGLTLGHMLLTMALPDGPFLIFFVVLVTWAGDTGAYYAGVTLGRKQLAPAISPNKTIEGLIGGLCLALLTAVVAKFWFLPSFSIMDCLATGLLLTAAGVLGDLSESMLKRSAGVKDSGAIIPSHGGMLDRVDSLLFTAPTFYYYVTLLKG